jgi:hypothetical protein
VGGHDDRNKWLDAADRVYARRGLLAAVEHDVIVAVLRARRAM